jgi:hypothetical protein
LTVDHDHDTGVVRALLCDDCSIAEGHLRVAGVPPLVWAARVIALGVLGQNGNGRPGLAAAVVGSEGDGAKRARRSR